MCHDYPDHQHAADQSDPVARFVNSSHGKNQTDSPQPRISRGRLNLRVLWRRAWTRGMAGGLRRLETIGAPRALCLGLTRNLCLPRLSLRGRSSYKHRLRQALRMADVDGLACRARVLVGLGPRKRNRRRRIEATGGGRWRGAEERLGLSVLLVEGACELRSGIIGMCEIFPCLNCSRRFRGSESRSNQHAPVAGSTASPWLPSA
eukprot:747621-Hanusia_phi.AAC.1